METENENLGEKKWNNHQERTHELNEGFSSENIPTEYNPSDESIENRLKPEVETDSGGNQQIVGRSRFPDAAPQENTDSFTSEDDNRVIENRQSLQNRDRNYDIDPNRYPPSHPENGQNRGNIELEE